MRTYLDDPDSGLSIDHDVDKVYIRFAAFDGGEEALVILLNEEIDGVIDALKRIKADIQRKRQERIERDKLAAWNAAAARDGE